MEFRSRNEKFVTAIDETHFLSGVDRQGKGC